MTEEIWMFWRKTSIHLSTPKVEGEIVEEEIILPIRSMAITRYHKTWE